MPREEEEHYNHPRDDLAHRLDHLVHPCDDSKHHIDHPDHPGDDQVPKPVTNRLSTPREEEALIYLGIGATVAFVLSAGTLVRQQL